MPGQIQDSKSWLCPDPVLNLSQFCPTSVLYWVCPEPVQELSWFCLISVFLLEQDTVRTSKSRFCPILVPSNVYRDMEKELGKILNRFKTDLGQNQDRFKTESRQILDRFQTDSGFECCQTLYRTKALPSRAWTDTRQTQDIFWTDSRQILDKILILS